MNKQIVDMRTDLIEICNEEYERRNLITPQNIAEKMTERGYRKASDVARDVLREVENLGDLYQMPDGQGLVIKIKDFVELKKKYESEGTNGNL